MKFSILIPVYNVEKYLCECLDSVRTQTYKDFEIILIDDGSTDNSGQICDKYCSHYPKQFKVIHKANQGLISARRIGIQNANGEFCIFVDSDDNVEAELLATLSDYLERDDEIDIVLYSYRYLRNSEKVERRPVYFADGSIWTKENRRELLEALLFTNNITSICTKAIRTRILQRDPIDYTQYYRMNMAEDLLQSLFPIMEARKVCYADRALYNYRINGESISHSFKLDRVRKNNTLHVYKEIIKFLPQWGMDTSDVRMHLDARWFHDAIYQFVKCYENADNRGEIKKILTYDWMKMLPEELTAEAMEANQYVGDMQKRLWKWIENRNYLRLRLYFAWKRIYKNLRDLWRKIKW